MNCTAQLPAGYEQVLEIDMQNNKKLAWLVNGLAAAIMVVMFILGCLISPFRLGEFRLLHMLSLLFGLFAYIVLHELTHGVCMKLYGSKTVKYGFTALYAYAGSSDYFGRTAHRIISLAPIVIWSVVLLALNFFVDGAWFWVIYWLQICNVSGAAGDLFVTVKFAKMPSDILIRDSGAAMTVYARQNP